MQKYTLNLRTLLSLLGEAGQNGRLTADLPSGIRGLRERCRARILLQEGKVVHCEINRRDGHILTSGNEAVQLLLQLRSCVWQLEETLMDDLSPLRTSTSIQPFLSDGREVIPQRTSFINQQVLEQLSRRQRQVFSLVDGVRTVEKITFLLFASSDEQNIRQIVEIMQEIRAKGLITISSA